MSDEQESYLLYLYSIEPDDLIELDGAEFSLYRVELVILAEDKNGNVTVSEYDSKDELDEAWYELTEEALAC